MPDKITIDDFPILKSKHVYIKDTNATINIINIMLRGGADHLQVYLENVINYHPSIRMSLDDYITNTDL